MWQVSGKPTCVQLHFDVIDRMHPQVIRGFAMLKSRGIEIGGILLGRSEAGLPRTVSIEDFYEVRSEYLTEGTYLAHRQGNPLLGLLPREHAHFGLRSEHRALRGATSVGTYRATQVKFEASSVLPLPLYAATCG
jgi:hypothetical protein